MLFKRTNYIFNNCIYLNSIWLYVLCVFNDGYRQSKSHVWTNLLAVEYFHLLDLKSNGKDKLCKMAKKMDLLVKTSPLYFSHLIDYAASLSEKRNMLKTSLTWIVHSC